MPGEAGIGTTRLLLEVRPEADTRMARLIARLAREHLCQTLALHGLDESEVRQLIRGLGLVRPSSN
jgi:hypothetical protein